MIFSSPAKYSWKSRAHSQIFILEVMDNKFQR